MPDHEAEDLTLLSRRWSEGSDEAPEQPAFRGEGELLHISTRQAQRELRLAQAWLYRELNAIQDGVNESSPMAKDK
jgi:hypothetical protein